MLKKTSARQKDLNMRAVLDVRDAVGFYNEEAIGSRGHSRQRRRMNAAYHRIVCQLKRHSAL